jgi:hypothetical protein
MNIKTVIRHLEVLNKIEVFDDITTNLIEEVSKNEDLIKNLTLKDYKFKMKHLLLGWCYDNNISIKYKDLNLLHFIDGTFGICNLDLVKLDAWLYNKLLDEFGYTIHSMSGMEKFKLYVDKNKNMMRWVK